MSDATEADLLLRFLNGQRRHVLGILEGLPEDQLRPVLFPEGRTPNGASTPASRQRMSSPCTGTRSSTRTP